MGKIFVDLAFAVVIAEFSFSTEQDEEWTCCKLYLLWEEMYGEVTELSKKKAKTQLSSETAERACRL